MPTLNQFSGNREEMSKYREIHDSQILARTGNPAAGMTVTYLLENDFLLQCWEPQDKIIKLTPGDYENNEYCTVECSSSILPLLRRKYCHVLVLPVTVILQISLESRLDYVTFSHLTTVLGGKNPGKTKENFEKVLTDKL